ncbi:unnamed protein product [Trichobilharzia regenti]|nr:unnamed protein product [Trichobilharzia regenti]
MDFSTLISKVKSSECPLSLLKEYLNRGVVLKQFNNCEEMGLLVCFLVSKTYGLGLKILLDCGLDMSASHPITGDTPLIVLCNEGLCGAIKQLMNELTSASLLHSNCIGLTALTQLLCRAHGTCSCLESLLSHLQLCSALLPTNMKTDNCVYSLTANKSSNEGSGNQVLFTLEQLLSRIKSDNGERIISVLQLWVKANLLLLSHIHEDNLSQCCDQLTSNTNSLKERLLKPLVSSISCSPNIGLLANKLEVLLYQLIILGQLHECSIFEEITHSNSDELENRSLDNMLSHIRSQLNPPLSLRFLIIREIRRILQYRFISLCQLNDKPHPSVTKNVLSFVTWVNQLSLPFLLKQHILLDPIIVKSI